MIRKLTIYNVWLISIIISAGCSKAPLNPQETLIKTDPLYDQYASELMLAVHQSLSDKQFCKHLKEEVMKLRDGDYEVLLKTLAVNMPGFVNTPVYACLGANKLKGTNDVPEVLKKYPKFQVAIPAGAGKWDGVSRIHVAYLPSDYNEGTTLQIPAIAPDGSRVMLDAVKEPDFPVIVIGLNERCNENGVILPFYNREPKPSVRLKYGEGGGFNYFTAEASANSMAVFLDWDYLYPEDFYWADYYFAVFRDDLAGEGFMKIAEISPGTMYYNDISVQFGKTYSYYVAAMIDLNQTYDRNYFEPYHTTGTVEVKTVSPPDFLEDFSVECTSPSAMDLKWKIKTVSNWTDMEIYRQTTYNSAWQLVASLPASAVSYQDVLSNPYPAYNVKYTYKLQVSNRYSGEMQAFSCAEYLSNRYDNMRTKINSLSFPSYTVLRDRYEGWPRGNPEWRIEVAAPKAGEGFQVSYFEWEGIKSCCETLSNKIVSNWPESFLGNVLTIYMTEIDGTPATVTLNLGVTAKVKLFDKIDFGPSADVTFKFQLGDGDDVVGKALYYFWNNANAYDFYIGDCRLNLSQMIEW